MQRSESQVSEHTMPVHHATNPGREREEEEDEEEESGGDFMEWKGAVRQEGRKWPKEKEKNLHKFPPSFLDFITFSRWKNKNAEFRICGHKKLIVQKSILTYRSEILRREIEYRESRKSIYIERAFNEVPQRLFALVSLSPLSLSRLTADRGNLTWILILLEFDD